MRDIVKELKDRLSFEPTIMADEIMKKRHYTERELNEECRASRFAKMCSRLARTVAKTSEDENEFYLMMSRGLFIPSSPYLANCGISNNNMSCFVIPVEDSIEGIFESVKKSSKVQACYGGTGFDFSVLRPKGWDVKSMARGGASGPVAFMQIYDASAKSVYQGGARSGAMMAVLRVDHPDIREFIHCKDKDGVLSGFNISVAITDEFMEAVKMNLPEFQLQWEGILGDKVNPVELWNEICQHAWSKAEPGLLFIDEINRDNYNLKTLGPVTATNPCGEANLRPGEACNLGSINLSKMISGGELDEELLGWTTRTATKFLDYAYDINEYPLEEIKRETLKARKIGIGIMGWADFLCKLGIRYDSDLALELADEIMCDITDYASIQSYELGEKLGENSYIDDGTPIKGRRNSAVTSIAPNGTIGLILNANGGIEPFFSLVYNRKVTNHDGTKSDYLVAVEPFEAEFGELPSYDSLVKATFENGGRLPIGDLRWNFTKRHEDMFVISKDIDPLDHVNMQSAFQTHVEMSISKTINLPREATVEDVEQVYMFAHDSGCKGITVYRDGCREDQVLSTGGKTEGDSDKSESVNIQQWTYKGKDDRPKRLSGHTWFVRTVQGRYYITINGIENRPLEIFATPHSSDVESNVDAEALCRTVSLLLRSRVPLELIKDQLEKVRCQSLLSLPHNIKLCLDEFVAPKADGVYECPECHEMSLVYEGGCNSCKVCGWSKCG